MKFEGVVAGGPGGRTQFRIIEHCSLQGYLVNGMGRSVVEGPGYGTRCGHAMRSEYQDDVCTCVAIGVVGSQVSQERVSREGGEDRESTVLLQAIQPLYQVSKVR